LTAREGDVPFVRGFKVKRNVNHIGGAPMSSILIVWEIGQLSFQRPVFCVSHFHVVIPSFTSISMKPCKAVLSLPLIQILRVKKKNPKKKKSKRGEGKW